MIASSFNESIVEDAALTWFGELGYAVGHGPHLAPGEPAAESACALHADRRDSFSEVVLVRRLREAIRQLNLAIRSRTPATLRDTLLLKVLSGKLSTGALSMTQ